jgi:nucleoside permease NupC
MAKNIILFVLLLLAVSVSNCPVNPNNLAKVSGDVMHLLSETTNGQKFVIGDINSTDRLFVAKLKGTPYEMGKAFGTMFKEEIAKILQSFFAYYGDQVLPLSYVVD